MKMHALFLCSQNYLRSPTAEIIFAGHPHVEVLSAGLDGNATRTVTEADILWSDCIFVMERSHRNRLLKKFRTPVHGKRIICLEIPDIYERMDPELISLLLERAGRYF